MRGGHERRQLGILTTVNNLLPVVQHGSAFTIRDCGLSSPGPVRLILQATSEIHLPPFAFASTDATTPGHQTDPTSEREPQAEIHVQRQVSVSEG